MNPFMQRANQAAKYLNSITTGKQFRISFNRPLIEYIIKIYVLQKYFQLKNNGNSKSFHTIMHLRYIEKQKKTKKNKKNKKTKKTKK